jgi:hypothetical protein
MSSIDLTSLAAQLTALSSDDAATLLDAIHGLTERAQKAREERTRAEAERDALALTCGCGKPVARFRFLECVEEVVTLGTIWSFRGSVLKGGYVAHGDTWDGGQKMPSPNPVFTTVWFSCGHCDQWTEIEGGRDTHIAGWE